MNNQNYSLGFLRYDKLSSKKKQNCFLALHNEGFGKGLENHEELKRRLAEMTEDEFKAFKKQN